MNPARPHKLIRAGLPCSDEAEFQAKVAPTLAMRGLFVPSPSPSPVGAMVLVELKLRSGQIALLGEAVVARHADPGKPSGMLLKLISLAPGSMKVDLSAPAAPAAPESDFEEPTVAQAPDEKLLSASKAEVPEQTGLEPFDVLNNYQLLRALGAGGMAEVFLARSNLGEGVERLVALKTVRPRFGPDTSLGTLFLNEARISVTLQHPNLVQVYDFGEARGRPYLAMEYVHGRTVSQVLRYLVEHHQRPSIALTLAVGIGVCRALEYLHSKKDLEERPLNLVHRDVSPANILISSRGEVKLLDLGVASASSNDSAEWLLGKYTYMPPEQTRGEPPNASWDVYALGLVLHQLLTLEQLSGRHTPGTLRDLGGPARLLLPPGCLNEEVPSILDRAVLEATDLEPQRRLRSARALRELLEQAQAQLPPADLAAQMQSMFGIQFDLEQTQTQELLARGRTLVPSRSESAGLARSIKSVRRKVLTSSTGTHLMRYPKLIRAALVLAVGAAGAGGYQAYQLTHLEQQFVQQLALADVRQAEGELVGSEQDAALDHLLAARALKPQDPRVMDRLALLAERFEWLGDGAIVRSDWAEAAVHFQAALLAEPERSSASRKLDLAKQEVQAASTAQSRSSP